ncbi:hypothetical protein JB92DRAFT_3025085 [Gautieria morchelliformis]|nr:hypothetical protein JB92DRAFT_3025085 [Gautieria morchelliformis]
MSLSCNHWLQRWNQASLHVQELQLCLTLDPVTPTKYSTVASLAFLVYDHAITFDAEVANVWNRPGSFGKILFIWTRYFGLSSLIIAVTGTSFHGSLSAKYSPYPFSCSGFFWWEAISLNGLIVSVDVILMGRVYAVYNNNKRLIYGVAGVRLVTFVAIIVIWALYLPPGVTEIVLCACMLYKAWITYKYNYGSPLLKVLVVDRSAFIVVLIFAALLTNTLLFFIAPRGLVLIALGWEYAVACAMGSRLLLSMFKQASRQQILTGQSCDIPSYSLSDIRMQGQSASHVETSSVLS